MMTPSWKLLMWMHTASFSKMKAFFPPSNSVCYNSFCLYQCCPVSAHVHFMFVLMSYLSLSHISSFRVFLPQLQTPHLPMYCLSLLPGLLCLLTVFILCSLKINLYLRQGACFFKPYAAFEGQRKRLTSLYFQGLCIWKDTFSNFREIQSSDFQRRKLEKNAGLYVVCCHGKAVDDKSSNIQYAVLHCVLFILQESTKGNLGKYLFLYISNSLIYSTFLCRVEFH